MKLTSARICAQHPGTELSQINRANFGNCGVSEVDDISPITGLERLDLSRNGLTGESLNGIQWSLKLRHLDISRNEINTLRYIEELTNLEVLNAGNNKIESLDQLIKLKKFKALILNNNEIRSAEGLGRFQDLNSLALMPMLIKLTLSHNNLHEFPDLSACPVLKELRLNGNKIASIPNLETRIPLLELLDLGNNPITSDTNLSALKPLRRLVNLCLKGCPVEKKLLTGDLSPNVNVITSWFRNLVIFNNHHLGSKDTRRTSNTSRSNRNRIKMAKRLPVKGGKRETGVKGSRERRVPVKHKQGYSGLSERSKGEKSTE